MESRQKRRNINFLLQLSTCVHVFQSLLAFKTPHQVSLGQLWLELLKFYTLEFALEEYVISIRVQELLTRENKNWPKRRIAIEGRLILPTSVVILYQHLYWLNLQMCYKNLDTKFLKWMYFVSSLVSLKTSFLCLKGRESH